MELVMAGLPPTAFWLALAITIIAGFVKGTIGFAMPMIMISTFSSFLPPETALAAMILPTLVTNLSQAFRTGPSAVWQTIKAYWRFLTGTLIFIVISAQFVRDIPQPLFLMLLGLPITVYAALQLFGVSFAIKLEHRTRAEWVLGVIAGLYGGVSGVWGPPLIVYLMSVAAPKAEMLRVQGVVFLLGAVILLGAHINSGVMTAPNAAFSAVLILPAMVGMTIGYRVGDRLDQVRFRWWTQIFLILTGLNLVRRAIGL